MYLNILQQWQISHLPEDKGDFILPQDGALAHFLGNVRNYLNAEFPVRWIGRASGDDNLLLL